MMCCSDFQHKRSKQRGQSDTQHLVFRCSCASSGAKCCDIFRSKTDSQEITQAPSEDRSAYRFGPQRGLVSEQPGAFSPRLLIGDTGYLDLCFNEKLSDASHQTPRLTSISSVLTVSLPDSYKRQNSVYVIIALIIIIIIIIMCC